MNNEKERATETASGTQYAKTVRTKGSKNGRFNVVDFFLLLIILAMIAALVIYIVPGISKRLSATEESEITFSLEFKNVDGMFVSNIQKGDPVYDSGKNYMLGNVKSVENYAATVLVYNEETGAAEMLQHPELKNVIVTVSATAIYTDEEGYSINGERIAVGCGYNISFPQFSGEAYCIEVSVNAN